MKTNILVQYKGGGYSGCFWEWNYFYIDKDGGFHDVFSSGRAGIKTLEDAKKEVEKEEPFIYNMGVEAEIKSFVAESNAVNVTGVLQFFEDNADLGVEFFVVCSECGCHITDQDNIRLENWHGCGGIATTADVLLCYECHASGVCQCCNEYVGEEDTLCLDSDGFDLDDDYKNKAVKQMKKDGYTDVCSGCLEYQADLIEQEDHQDMLFASLCTGKPDFFSEEMRWFWV